MMQPRRGLLLGTLLAMPFCAQAGEYTPLNCAKAHSASEKAVCGSYALGQDEARMATLYAIATSLVAMGQRGDIADQQRVWLRKREACGDRTNCLADAYATRIKELDGIISGIASRGPF